MYALLDIKGKQYKAIKGELLKIDKINAKKDDKIEFSNVIIINKDRNIKIGKPYIPNTYVKGTYKEDRKDKKVVSYIYRRRKASERKVGHRQIYSYVLIDEIVGEF